MTSKNLKKVCKILKKSKYKYGAEAEKFYSDVCVLGFARKKGKKRR